MDYRYLAWNAFAPLAFLIAAGCSLDPATQSQDGANLGKAAEQEQPAVRGLGLVSTNIAKHGHQPRRLPLKNAARVQFDANGDGITDLFVGHVKYSLNQTPETASKSDFILFLGTKGGGFARDTATLDGVGKGCIHPRKAVVNDYNRDGRLDVFVACTGWDKRPFPGERNKIVLSQPDGTYVIQDAGTQTGFFHGAASADFDGDGNPDVAVTNDYDERASVRIWLGNGRGGFRPSTNRVPSDLKRLASHFTVELPDANGDGRFDLFVAGHEHQGAATKIYLNKADRGFQSGEVISIPAVENKGVVLDVLATGARGNRVLWILRTSGGGDTFYKGVCVQVFNLQSRSSRLIHCEERSRWVPWLISWSRNGQTYVSSDDTSDLIVAPDGSRRFLQFNAELGL